MGKAERIKERVTIPMLLRELGYLREGNSGRMPCPIHGGEDNNFSVHRDYYKCFTCGSCGDVIQLVCELNCCDFPSACRFIDALFNLGLDKPPSREEKERARKRKERARKLKATREYSRRQYMLLCRFSRWLRAREESEATRKDLEYLDRILDKYLCERERLIGWDAKSRISALLTKHEEVT